MTNTYKNKIYTNVPSNKVKSSSDQTVQVFDQYYSNPVELNSNALSGMIGYLESKDFSSDSAEMISIAILRQAKIDGYNPFIVLQTVKGLESVELSKFIGEILNFNRFKTSTLGNVVKVTPIDEIKRNIKA